MNVRNLKRAAVVAGLTGATLAVTALPAAAGPWQKQNTYNSESSCQAAGATAVHYANETYSAYKCPQKSPVYWELWLHLR